MAQLPKNQYRNGAGATVPNPEFKDQYRGPLDAKNTGRVATAYNTNIEDETPDMGKQFTHGVIKYLQLLRTNELKCSLLNEAVSTLLQPILVPLFNKKSTTLYCLNSTYLRLV